jgi:uncharacterized protein (TIGR00255 family)
MTGFARCETETGFGTLACELRAVNHRHLELSLRIPEECRPVEAALREAVATRVARGKLDLSLHLRRSAGKAAPIELDDELLTQLINAIHAVASKLGQAAPPDPVALLKWPGVVTDTERDYTPLHEEALALLQRTLDDLVAGREREGERIVDAIRARASSIKDIVGEVRTQLPGIQARYRERLLARIAELGAEPEPGRLEQELAIVAQRQDVAEELERLESHVVELESVLTRDEPVGRRLDFLLQEFNREANTLGSKSQDTETTRAAVDLKVLIEQVREQVQNVE